LRGERRKYPRVKYPLEGNWHGSAGTVACRIGDFSLGGCYIYARALPTLGQPVEIAVAIGDDMLTFGGTVMHLDPTLGFSVEFRNLSTQQQTQIQQILEAVTTG